MVVDLRNTLARFDPVGAFQRKRSNRQRRNAKLRDLLFRIERRRAGTGVPLATKGEMHSRHSTERRREGELYSMADDEALGLLQSLSHARQLYHGGMTPRRNRHPHPVQIRQPGRTEF